MLVSRRGVRGNMLLRRVISSVKVVFLAALVFMIQACGSEQTKVPRNQKSSAEDVVETASPSIVQDSGDNVEPDPVVVNDLNNGDVTPIEPPLVVVPPPPPPT